MDNSSQNQYMQALEQCRDRLLALASQGAEAVNAEVFLAEQQLQTQITKLEQARKISAFSQRQYEVVNEALNLGEAQLTKAMEEENDARTALEAMQNIMGDAGFMRFADDLDMTKIMKKAENVLGDTLIRAEENFREKETARREQEASLMTRRTAERVAFFTIAQSERFAGETDLARTTAERNRDVLRSTQDILQLEAECRDLAEAADRRRDELRELEEALARMEELHAESVRVEAAFRLEAEQEYAAAVRENETLLAEINGRIQACTEEQQAEEQERSEVAARTGAAERKCRRSIPAE